MGGRDKDGAARVSSLANEEPLVVVETGIDIVREVVGKDCGDSRGGVVGEGEAPLRGGRCRSVRQWSSGTEDGDIGCSRGVRGHRGSKVFATWRGDKDVIGIDSNILVERGEEESVENLLGDSGRGGRHG